MTEMYDKIVNDVINGEPVAIKICTVKLCNVLFFKCKGNLITA